MREPRAHPGGMHTHEGPRRPTDSPPLRLTPVLQQAWPDQHRTGVQRLEDRAVLSLLFSSLFQCPAFKGTSVKTLAEHELKE